ncbi:hypothetical protein CPB83DRAFT_888713 [Crepidotus variabilis]|uniref:Uncharacterized protein n=1 Tax=Crepidotus variabilis TaxID=179855 RepID=A0A9P6ET90_9AGAR|nr:hypothetical protein CPB83DRAFT_888713 [Crepidotus variabilis]
MASSSGYGGTPLTTTTASVLELRDEVLHVFDEYMKRRSAQLSDPTANLGGSQRMRELAQEAIDESRRLGVENKELRRQLDGQKSDTENAVAAREAAFRKLNHSRKVLRDLLIERGDLGNPRTPGSVTQAEIEEALGEEFQLIDSGSESTSSSESSSPKSEQTVRAKQKVVSTPSEAFDTPQHSSAMIVKQLSPSESNPTGSRSAQSSSSNLRRTPLIASGSTDSLMGSVLLQQSNIHDSPGEPMSIHFTKIPGTSITKEGPFTFASLKEQLNLNDASTNALQAVATSSKPMRAYITRILGGKYTVAFLYDPIFVENRHKTFLVDWGRSKDIKALTKDIATHTKLSLAFHTFTFPKKGNSWFYIGAQHWLVGGLSNLWPFEDSKSSQKLVTKLCEHTSGEVTLEDMTKQLNEERMKQMSIELMGVPDAQESRKFAGTVLGRTVSGEEPKYEGRRGEGVKA